MGRSDLAVMVNMLNRKCASVYSFEALQRVISTVLLQLLNHSLYHPQPLSPAVFHHILLLSLTVVSTCLTLYHPMVCKMKVFVSAFSLALALIGQLSNRVIATPSPRWHVCMHVVWARGIPTVAVQTWAFWATLQQKSRQLANLQRYSALP
jgi:hypothetical protein